MLFIACKAPPKPQGRHESAETKVDKHLGSRLSPFPELSRCIGADAKKDIAPQIIFVYSSPAVIPRSHNIISHLLAQCAQLALASPDRVRLLLKYLVQLPAMVSPWKNLRNVRKWRMDGLKRIFKRRKNEDGEAVVSNFATVRRYLR